MTYKTIIYSVCLLSSATLYPMNMSQQATKTKFQAPDIENQKNTASEQPKAPRSRTCKPAIKVCSALACVGAGVCLYGYFMYQLSSHYADKQNV